MSESYRDILSKLVEAQRETALATTVLAENVAALHETLRQHHAETMQLGERMTTAAEATAEALPDDGMDS